jgi:hypothetical protein
MLRVALLGSGLLGMAACQVASPRQITLMRGVPVPTQAGVYEPKYDLEIWTRTAVIFRAVDLPMAVRRPYDDSKPRLSILHD